MKTAQLFAIGYQLFAVFSKKFFGLTANSEQRTAAKLFYHLTYFVNTGSELKVMPDKNFTAEMQRFRRDSPRFLRVTLRLLCVSAVKALLLVHYRFFEKSKMI
jgi:hypothetical protein